MKHRNCKLYYQQVHLKYWCNLARYWSQAVWGWHDSVETCSSVIICEINVHLLVIVQNKKKHFPRILSLILGFFRQNFTETRSVSTITGTYSVAPPKIKLFSIINLYALRLWHMFCGIKAPVLYTEILWSKPTERPKSVQTSKFESWKQIKFTTSCVYKNPRRWTPSRIQPQSQWNKNS